jgi:uncharacterized protein
VSDVVAEAFENLANGPTLFVGDECKAAAQVFGSVSRKEAVELVAAAIEATMAPPSAAPVDNK